ncbi:hypothetical protein [Synechococcus sp. UW140]|uniref:hypothetical protein n=1 Tax=Synechococcus sp. UW140 TaxID=368503 RepID=UPI000E0E53D2|nr:hypothetical protein [Synechococcus sp. UW140]
MGYGPAPVEQVSEWSESLFKLQFFRSTLLPALIVLLFALALVAVSARIWLPGDMLAPAPIG